VKAALEGAVLLQADVTSNSNEDKALLKRYGLFGPPAIILFDGEGKELARVIGYQDAARFQQTLAKLK
jgi:thioredoxin:protein disulfide reductase